MPKSLATPVLAALFAGGLLLLQGCSPEVGTEAWCKQMEGKPKGDWSVNDAGDFAKSCILK
ncbi:DUF3012 domain-containing protein [Marinobacterium sedimentorum]|uniref:DUF3012 domain-containing protein n=1 Tax=Marinobacterium sedimentorum TaxID=2927804 RepID=UPI0020C6C643|nr:DUF3012 domain-containing protein [Marinobacterium sedimentorum]MCP8690485.1 DUF3012 domain-containing protein [Marinobacterium sedimentorum]